MITVQDQKVTSQGNITYQHRNAVTKQWMIILISNVVQIILLGQNIWHTYCISRSVWFNWPEV